MGKTFENLTWDDMCDLMCGGPEEEETMNENGRKIVDKLIEIHGGTDFTIAFLPYKRSMWDSMESVYEECLASGIDAHCMPIPYYRLKEDMKIDCIDSDFKYFGDIAEDVKNLEKIKPDYIAIQYHYENQNRVTNMLPEYFTKALKEKYKAKIVFLPYGIGFGDPRLIEIFPGVRDVDYLFHDRAEVIDNFIEAWKQYGVDFTGRVWGFGSPKIDAAKKAAARKVIPDEWKDTIKDNPVTLVITSLMPYIRNPYVKLLEYRQAVYRERKKGNVVLFRPHPLMRNTIRAMLPETTGYYGLLMNDLYAMDGVIIDESEYLERAMSAADYLVSDPSSVLEMWKATGKPYEVTGGEQNELQQMEG